MMWQRTVEYCVSGMAYGRCGPNRNGRPLGQVPLASTLALILGQMLLIPGFVDGQIRLLPLPRSRSVMRTDSVANRTKREAEQAYQQGNYQKAVELANSVLRINAGDDVALYLRASASVELGQSRNDAALVREGIADAREAIRLTGTKNTDYYLPYIYGMLKLATIEKHKSHAEVAMQIANQLLANSKLKKEQQANLLYQRAGLHMFLQDPNRAIQDYEEAIRNQSSHLGAYIALADAYRATGNTQKVGETLNQTVQAFPNNPLVYNNRGMYRQHDGKPQDAILDFSRAIELDANYYIAYLNRGFTLLETGKPLEAENDFSASLKIHPDQPLAHSLRGTARLTRGKLDLAIEDYQKVVQLDPQNPVAYTDLGFARFFTKEYRGARTEFDNAMKLDAEIRYLDPWRYWASVLDGHTEDARTQFSAVRQKKKDQRDWIDYLLLFLQGEVDEKGLLDVIPLSDTSVQAAQTCEAHFFIGQVETLAGRTDEATRHFHLSLATNARHLSAYRGAQFALGQFSEPQNP